MKGSSVFAALAMALLAPSVLATDFLDGPLLAPDQCDANQPQQCLDGVTTAVTTVDGMRVSGNRAGDALRESQEQEIGAGSVVWRGGGGSGLAAGELGGGWGAWLGYTRANFESEVDIAPYDADVHSWTLGIDRLFVAANLNAVVSRGGWVLAARAGVLHTEEEHDGYTETGGPSARTVGERNLRSR